MTEKKTVSEKARDEFISARRAVTARINKYKVELNTAIEQIALEQDNFDQAVRDGNEAGMTACELAIEGLKTDKRVLERRITKTQAALKDGDDSSADLAVAAIDCIGKEVDAFATPFKTLEIEAIQMGKRFLEIAKEMGVIHKRAEQKKSEMSAIRQLFGAGFHNYHARLPAASVNVHGLRGGIFDTIPSGAKIAEEFRTGYNSI